MALSPYRTLLKKVMNKNYAFLTGLLFLILLLVGLFVIQTLQNHWYLEHRVQLNELATRHGNVLEQRLEPVHGLIRSLRTQASIQSNFSTDIASRLDELSSPPTIASRVVIAPVNGKPVIAIPPQPVSQGRLSKPVTRHTEILAADNSTENWFTREYSSRYTQEMLGYTLKVFAPNEEHLVETRGNVINLVQPVYIKDNYWGFIEVTVPTSRLLTEQEIHQLTDLHLDYQLSIQHGSASESITLISTRHPSEIQHAIHHTMQIDSVRWLSEYRETASGVFDHKLAALYVIAFVMAFIMSHWFYALMSENHRRKKLIFEQNRVLAKTNQQLQEEQLQLKKLSNAIKQSGNAVIITNVNGIIEYVNPRFTQLTGFTAEEAVGKKTNILRSEYTNQEDHRRLWQTILAGQTWFGERRNKHKTGKLYWTQMTISPIKNELGEIVNYVSVSEDISELKERNMRIEFMANHDPLTELANRRHFLNTLQTDVQRYYRNHIPFVLAFIDLDKFKEINDEFGHEVGDKLLCEVGSRLQRQVRSTDMVARIGGDEFTMILHDVHTEANAHDIGRKLQQICEEPIVHWSDDRRIIINFSISIGLAICNSTSFTDKKLMQRADSALYVAKNAGRNQYSLDAPEIPTSETAH